MTREISANTITEIAKDETDDVLSFVDIFLDGETLRFVNNDLNLSFFDLDGNPQTYNALKMGRTKREESMDMEIQVINAGLDNVDQAFASYIASKQFRDRRIVIRGCFRNLISVAANAWIIYDGIIDKPNIGEKEFSISIVPRLGRGTLNSKIGIKQQLPCRLPFAIVGGKCAYDIAAATLKDEKTDQTVDSGAVTYVVDAARTEADDYWNYGYITFNDDTTTTALQGISRMIKDFVAADDKIYPVFSFPAIPVAGDTYKIERGCDLTLDSCQNKFSNQANYGGIHTLPAIMVRRSIMK
ncbi:MAG: phage BR0599 family protein [Candidatus Aureabacteria bacterium]|nr:phage BR0599 family protein [Candidatus Auribacterota bacterium]